MRIGDHVNVIVVPGKPLLARLQAGQAPERFEHSSMMMYVFAAKSIGLGTAMIVFGRRRMKRAQG